MSDNNQSKVQQVVVKQKTSTGQKIIIILIVLLIIGGGTFAFIFFNNKKNTTESSSATSGNYVIDSNNAKDVQSALAPGMFECKMTTSWNFADGNTASNDATVENATSNTKPFYIDVTLDDTKESVFKSDVVLVGNSLSKIKLSKDLPAGKYTATCTYYFMKYNEKNEIVESPNDKVSFALTINIAK